MESIRNHAGVEAHGGIVRGRAVFENQPDGIERRLLAGVIVVEGELNGVPEQGGVIYVSRGPIERLAAVQELADLLHVSCANGVRDRGEVSVLKASRF